MSEPSENSIGYISIGKTVNAIWWRTIEQEPKLDFSGCLEKSRNIKHTEVKNTVKVKHTEKFIHVPLNTTIAPKEFHLWNQTENPVGFEVWKRNIHKKQDPTSHCVYKTLKIRSYSILNPEKDKYYIRRLFKAQVYLVVIFVIVQFTIGTC